MGIVVIDRLFEFPSFGMFGDVRAMSDAELRQHANAQVFMMQNAKPSLLWQALATANYRPPVHVPPGWAEWSAHANEMV